MITSPVDFALALATGLVACVLAVSGASKIGRSAGTLTAMAALRVPPALRKTPVAAAVPVAEIVLALALLFAPGVARAAAGIAAAGLFVVFTALLIGVLARREEVDCGCFGPLAATDAVTGWSVARNLVLLAGSILVTTLAWGHGSFVADLLAADTPTLLALGLGWALIAVVVLIRGHIVLRRRLAQPRAVENAPSAPADERPPAPMSPASIALGLDPSRPGEPSPGESIPVSELVTSTGITRKVAGIGNGSPVLLIFLSAECGMCAPVASAIPAWQKTLAPMKIVVATSSAPDDIRATYPQIAALTHFGAAGPRHAFGVQRSPAAVALGGREQPVVASPVAYGFPEINALVDALLAARA